MVTFFPLPTKSSLKWRVFYVFPGEKKFSHCNFGWSGVVLAWHFWLSDAKDQNGEKMKLWEGLCAFIMLKRYYEASASIWIIHELTALQIKNKSTDLVLLAK